MRINSKWLRDSDLSISYRSTSTFFVRTRAFYNEKRFSFQFLLLAAQPDTMTTHNCSARVIDYVIERYILSCREPIVSVEPTLV